MVLDDAAVQRIELGHEQLNAIDGELASLEEEAEAQRPTLIAFHTRQRELEAAIGRLAAYEETDASALDEVGSLWRRLEALPGQKRVGEVQTTPARDKAGRQAFLVGASVAVISIALAILVTPLFASGIVLALGLGYFGYRRGLAARTVEGTRDIDALPAGRAELEAALASALDRVGAPAGELDVRVAAYLTACGKRNELLEARLRHADLLAKIAAAAEPDRAIAEKRGEVTALREKLRSAYAALGISTGDLMRRPRHLRNADVLLRPTPRRFTTQTPPPARSGSANRGRGGYCSRSAR